MKIRNSAVFAITLSMLASSCSPYSGTRKMNEKTSIGFASAGDGVSVAAVDGISGFLIGWVFKEADKAVTKARTGDFKALGRKLEGDGKFPEHGYLVLARTVSDPTNKYPEIAEVKDLINETTGTAGGQLATEIAEKSGISHSVLRDTYRKSLGQGEESGQKIAMLVICEVVRLKGDYSGTDLRAVTFTGMYYPLLAGLRFAGESSREFSRILKSRESMLLEIYGPNGSGYTTGIVKIPLAWSPPEKRGERAHWLTQDDLFNAYLKSDDEKQRDKLKELLATDIETRLARRQAFVGRGELSHEVLRGDFRVSETSEATGWILKAVDKAKEAAEGVISDE